jgi:hypothetical protein
VDTLYSIRRERLRQLIAEHGGPLPLAKTLGLFGSSYLVQLAGPHPRREVSEKFARKIEAALGLPRGWMDLPSGQDAPRVAQPGSGSWDVAAAAGAVLGRLGAHHLHLDPGSIGLLIDLAYAHGPDPAFLDRLVALVERLTSPPR